MGLILTFNHSLTRINNFFNSHIHDFVESLGIFSLPLRILLQCLFEFIHFIRIIGLVLPTPAFGSPPASLSRSDSRPMVQKGVGKSVSCAPKEMIMVMGSKEDNV